MFTHRSLGTQDLERVFCLLREGFVFAHTDRDRLVAMWTELLGSESCRTVGG